MNKIRIWNKNDYNCEHYADRKVKCDVCGRLADRVYELKSPSTESVIFACAEFGKKRYCNAEAMQYMLDCHPQDEFILMRSVERLKHPNEKRTKGKIKRDPIGLSRRYNVMKRDGFLCVLCGASGADSKLEIDHIQPVSAGGSNLKDNLQTLCFKCNRGKGAKI